MKGRVVCMSFDDGNKTNGVKDIAIFEFANASIRENIISYNEYVINSTKRVTAKKNEDGKYIYSDSNSEIIDLYLDDIEVIKNGKLTIEELK